MTRLIGYGLIPVPFYEGSDALNVFLAAIMEKGTWDWDHCCSDLNTFLWEKRKQWEQDVTARLESGTLADLLRESAEGTPAVKDIAGEMIVPRLKATFVGLDDEAFFAAAEQHKSLGVCVTDWFEEHLGQRKQSYRATFTHVTAGALQDKLSDSGTPPFQRHVIQSELDRRNKRQRTAATNRGIRENWSRPSQTARHYDSIGGKRSLRVHLALHSLARCWLRVVAGLSLTAIMCRVRCTLTRRAWAVGHWCHCGEHTAMRRTVSGFNMTRIIFQKTPLSGSRRALGGFAKRHTAPNRNSLLTSTD